MTPLDKTSDGQVVNLITLRNNDGLTVSVLTYGGVIMSLLDVALCTAARTLHPESIGVITIDLSTSFIGGASGKKLFADARVMRDGRSMSFVEAEAKNEDGSLVAKAIATVRVRHKKEEK